MRDSRAIDVYAPPAEEAKVVASNMYIGDGFTSTNIYIYIYGASRSMDSPAPLSLAC